MIHVRMAHCIVVHILFIHHFAGPFYFFIWHTSQFAAAAHIFTKQISMNPVIG